MALVQVSGLISNIKGSIGGTTFSNTRAGLVAKRRLPGLRLPNTKQAGALNSSMVITNQWNALSSEQREVFNDYALANTYTSRYGLIKPLTGYQWYKQLAQAALYFNSESIVSPPPYAIPIAVPTFTVSVTATAIIVTWDAPIDTDDVYVYCYTTLPNRGQARNQRGAYRLTDIRGLDYSSSFDITAAWQAAHGLLLTSFTDAGMFNLHVQLFAINKSSFVSGVAQSSFGAYNANETGIGSAIIGYSFTIG